MQDARDFFQYFLGSVKKARFFFGSMAETKPDSATTTNVDNISYTDTAAFDSDFKYKPLDAGEEEYTYVPNWLKWKGYYDEVPELQAVIDKKAMWTVGRGYKALNPKTEKTLKRFRGNGIDSATDIFNNLVRTFTICGDSFAEIVRDARGTVSNLKPIAPNTVKIIANNLGVITRYEQWMDGKLVNAFKPNQIFHCAWQRLGDAIHGIGTISKLTDIIEARKEAFKDMRTVFHRYVKPLWIFSVDTDDTAEIAAFKAKLDTQIKKAENLIIPKGTVDKVDRVSIPQYSTLDPLPWIKVLQEFFLIAEGVPEVILGYGRETTEASSKILYEGFTQMVLFNQLYFETQLMMQVNLKLKFEEPPSLIDNLQQDNRKDGKQDLNKPSEVRP